MKKLAASTFTAAKLVLVPVSTVSDAILRVFKFTNLTVMFRLPFETMRTLATLVLLTDFLLYISRRFLVHF